MNIKAITAGGVALAAANPAVAAGIIGTGAVAGVGYLGYKEGKKVIRKTRKAIRRHRRYQAKRVVQAEMQFTPAPEAPIAYSPSPVAGTGSAKRSGADR